MLHIAIIYVDHQTLSLYSPEKGNWENKTQYFRLRLIDKVCPEFQERELRE